MFKRALEAVSAASSRRPAPEVSAPKPSSSARPAAAAVDLDAVVASMDKSYFDASFDPVAGLVAALPREDHALDGFVETRKVQQQLLLDGISARLSREVMANYASFIDGMRQISEIDMDVSRASIHVANSLRKLGSAKESLVVGTLGITYRRRRRERLADARSRLQWLRALVRVEQVVSSACAENRFSDAVHAVVEGQAALSDPAMHSYTVFAGLSSRVHGAAVSLQERTQGALEAQLCAFDPAVYGAILTAYAEMDKHGLVRIASAAGAAAAAFAEGGEDAAAAAVAARNERDRVERDRAGTLDVEGGDADLLKGFAAAGGGSGMDEGGGLSPTLLGGGGGNRSLLAEVGSSIAAAHTGGAAGILSVVHNVNGNLAALPARIAAAAARALKLLSKDALVDLLLRDVRERALREARSRGDDYSVDGEGMDADADAEPDAATDAALRDIAAMSSDVGGIKATPSEPAAKEYASRRTELLQRSFHDLAGSLTPVDVPAACMRIGAVAAHVMHQHFLLLQWHRTPLDSRNGLGDGEWLHRCALLEAEPQHGGGDEESAMMGVMGTAAAAAAAASVAAATTAARRAGPVDAALVSTLKALRPFLLRGRSIVWQHMQQRFGVLLFGAVTTCGVALPVERLAQCLVLARDVMAVGLEYVSGGDGGVSSGGGPGAAHGGASAVPLELDPCNTLRGSLRLLCSHYMDATHGEAFERLRGMLSREDWQRVPLSTANFASIIDAAQAGIRNTFSKAASAAVASATAAMLGQDLMWGGGAGGSGMGVDASLDASMDEEGARGGSVNRTYSDGASVFATWLERGNPFGALVIESPPTVVQPPPAFVGGSGGGPSSSFPALALDMGAAAAAANGSAPVPLLCGTTVLHTPRVVAEEEEEEEEEEEGGVGGALSSPGAGGGGASSAAAAAKAAALLSRRRALLRFMTTRIHGEGYTLEVGLGRNPGLGFGLPPAGHPLGDAISGGGAGGGAARGGGGGGDSDGSADEDDDDEVIDSGGASSEDGVTSDDDDDGAAGGKGAKQDMGGRRGTSGGGGAGGGSSGPYSAIFGSDTTHVVTAAALNGFAWAVGKHVLLMEVLPSVAADAFTGLAKLFELYLFTVATCLLRPPAQRQLFDVSAPVPHVGERERDASSFDYVDGSAVFVAACVASAAKEAGLGTAAAGRREGGGSRLLRRVNASGGYSGMSSGSGGGGGALDRSFSSDDGSMRRGGKGGRGEGGDGETVSLHGVTLYLRGLPALAQAQGLAPDYYSPTGPGAEAAAQLGGNANNCDALYLPLRRGLQLIGASLAAGVHRVGGTGGGASVFADGVFTSDTPASRAGVIPEPFVKLCATLEIEGEAAVFGISERCVAVESLEFLLEVLSRVRGRVEAHLPPAQGASVLAFFQRAVQCVEALRGLMYHSLVPRMLPESGAIPGLITAVKWDTIKDAMEPSKYTSELAPYLTRAATVLTERVSSGSLPAVSRFGVWSAIVSHVLERFVEGYSRIRKCTVPGRGLQSLDAGTMYAHAAKAGPIIPACLLRDKSHVDAYVAAFYYDNEHDLLGWISKNRAAYPLRHARGILLGGIGSSMKKKALDAAVMSVEALYCIPVPPPGALEKGASVAGTALEKLGASFLGGGV